MNTWVRAGRALLAGGVFLAGCIGWMLLLSGTAALAMKLAGVEFTDLEDFVEWLGGAGFGAASVVQIGGIAAVAVTLALLLGEDGWLSRPGTEWRERLRLAFPLQVQWAQMGVALLGGLTIWVLPSWIAQWLIELIPGDTSTPELLTDLLVSGSWLDRTVIVLAILVSAPLLEELVFRGYLWRVADQGFGWAGALAITTSLFALFHLDPVQSTALLPTALFLGWLRHTSGSLLPPMVGHLANNGIGVLITVFGPEEEVRIPFWAALLGLGLTITWAWAAWRVRPRAVRTRAASSP